MKCFPGSALGLVLMAVSAVAFPSCKRRAEAVKSDLSEAGYQLTAEDWFRASRGNDVAALKKFVAAGYAADTRNAAGDSALHAAAAGGAQGSADFLLSQKLAIDTRGASERTPLMAAVLADQTDTVRWLLRQGADPNLKDQEGFKPLMLAVREGKAGSVGELAAYDRQDLDPALLLAALVGRADVIDALTNYGASVYAKMEDGRTPLMVAAENGHQEAVALLLDLGAGRFTTDPDGKTAADLATAAGHPDIATLISKPPLPSELALDSTEEIARSMNTLVDTAVAKSSRVGGAGKFSTTSMPTTSIPIEGERLSGPVASTPPPGKASPTGGGDTFAMPPLVMRHYRQKQIPVSIQSVQGETATVSIATTAAPRQIKVKVGDTIPGTSLVVVRMQRRMEDSKVSLGKPSEISVVEVRDVSSGKSREWISGFPAEAHDPIALVEDSATGKRYVASPGQHFTGADGAEYLISDVRPNQMVIKDIASGAVRTIPLRGPRG
jgi:ankyrin repeat protein